MNERIRHDCAGADRERGGVMVAVLLTLVPLVLVLGAYTRNMGARMERLENDIDDERALFAAESGVDEVLYRARNGDLDESSFKRELGPDLSFTVEPTHLGSDGVDNDSDGARDEADEDVYQLIVTGRYRGLQRRLAAYLGRTSFLPVFGAASTIFNPGIEVDLRGSGRIDGRDYKIDGTRGDPSADAWGLGAVGSTTIDDLKGELSGGERSQVEGRDGSPSVGTSPGFDLDAMVGEARNAASVVITTSRYRDFHTETPSVFFRDGDLQIAGNMTASGLMVVTGNLRVTGNFKFNGVMIVLGQLDNAAGTIETYGTIILGPSASLLRMAGTADLRFSTQGIQIARGVTGRYVEFNGWQELPRY